MEEKLFDKEELKRELKNYFKKWREIKAVYIFGSFTKDRFNEESDIDLAVIFQSEIDKYQRFKLKLRLLYELEKWIERDFDLIDFESVDLKMKHQILAGSLISCSDQKRRVVLEKRALLNYIEMRKRYELIDKNLGKEF